ncbi:oligosaccharyl transferase alpha subunit [Gautieria morchelliformis]|nr:oligosaccharyl transferase alpha subunit [Gautieria morchelliformis]
MAILSWHRWPTALFLFLSLICTTVNGNSPSFENTAVVRTVELDGALTHITTRYSVRALKDGASEYSFALGEADGKLMTWIQAKAKDEGELVLKSNGFDSESQSWSYTATLPKPMKAHTDITLELTTVQSNAVKPVPATVRQQDPQSLMYDTDLFVVSPYTTVIQRTKIRSPTSKIHNYTEPPNLSQFTKDEPSASKSSATITYGPYNSIPVSTTPDFLSTQQRISIHYEIERAVLRVLSLHRTAEVSHWGSNLNIQDEIHLKNDGAQLKGQFSRLSYQIQAFQQLPMFGTMQSLTLHLPSGISSPYYYDLVGNVSTSKFRPSTPPKAAPLKGSPPQWSVLELKPRYPLLGGWNYSFTLGWDAPLGDSVKYDAEADRYVLGVPFWTPVPGASVDMAEVKIVLPEGATDIEIFEPFPMLSVTRSTHITYLDTIGRPAVVFKKDSITDNHTNNIYITYKVPFSAHLKKPLSVGTAMLGVFALALLARRVDPRLQKSPNK